MPHHSLRRNSRRFALALSLMLVAGAVAIPAFAKGPPKYFSVEVGELDGTFTVTFYNESPNTGLGAARITVPTDPFVEPQDLDGPSGSSVSFADGVIEVTDFGIGPRDSAAITFGVADCGETYTFADPEAKQANDFSGEPGNDLEDRTKPDSLTVDTDGCPGDGALADFDEDEQVADCNLVSEGEQCTITTEGGDGQKVTASIPPEKDAKIGLRTVGDDDIGDHIADAVRIACHAELEELEGPARLGAAVVHLLPVGFSGDNDLLVRNLIPRSQVNTDENRSAHIFQVCFAPEKGDPDDEIMASLGGEEVGTGLYRPVLLEDCGDDVPAPCVEDRSKVRADVVITYRIPAEDPWLM